MFNHDRAAVSLQDELDLKHTQKHMHSLVLFFFFFFWPVGFLHLMSGLSQFLTMSGLTGDTFLVLVWSNILDHTRVGSWGSL